MIDDELYDEIHKLVRTEYDYKFQGLQELIAEMVIKTRRYNTGNLQQRYDAVIFNLLGSPKTKIRKDKEDYLDDLRRAASLSNSYKELRMTPGKAAAVVARQRLLPSHNIGDKIPKMTDELTTKVANYTKKLKRNLKNIDQLAKEFMEEIRRGEESIMNHQEHVDFVKFLMSGWLDTHSRYWTFEEK